MPRSGVMVIIVMGFLSRRRDKSADGKEFKGGRKTETAKERERDVGKKKKNPSKSLILIQKESGGRGYTNNIRP